jgi:riboflavin kinase/FMN adenylyltransferase
MGRDFSCGYKGLGTAEKIAAWCQENGLGCDIVDEVRIDGIIVSSTYIRQLVAQGEMEKAAHYLGHPHTLTDTVGYGYKIGRSIGAPTINTRIPEGVLVPRHGVYATRVWLPSGPKPAVTNVGVRPTFDNDDHVTVESNILDFEGNLYGSQVRLEFLRFLRDEWRFPSQEALSQQIQRDIAATRAYFEAAK